MRFIDYRIVLLVGLMLCACSNSKSPVRDYKSHLAAEDLGEYLQVESRDSLISVDRSGIQAGLVRVNITNDSMSVLDPTAKEARDILVSDGKIAYRVDQSVRLWNEKMLPLRDHVLKLRTFHWLKDFGRITYETLEKESRFMTFRDDGSMLFDGPLPGSGRCSLVSGTDEFLIFQNADGLFYGRFGLATDLLVDIWPIEKGKAGAYASARFIGENLYVAYFDEDIGVLKLAKKSSLGNSFSTETVDGNAGQSYTGMDIAIFNDRGRAGLVYLDGWNLKVRWARFIDNQWKSAQLPISGAVGFYNQIIEETPSEILVGMHNFRSQGDDYKNSFEDLVTFRLSITGDSL